MRYYIVTAKCGHVGKGRYIPIPFAIRARSAAEAASIARGMPRVKHHHKDAILSVEEVTIFDYSELRWINHYDPYLQCESKREQQQEFDAIYFRILEDDTGIRRRQQSTEEKPVYAGKKRIRNVRQYAKEQAAAFAMAEAI